MKVLPYGRWEPCFKCGNTGVINTGQNAELCGCRKNTNSYFNQTQLMFEKIDRLKELSNGFIEPVRLLMDAMKSIAKYSGAKLDIVKIESSLDSLEKELKEEF